MSYGTATDYTDNSTVECARYSDNWTEAKPVDRIQLDIMGTNGIAYLKVEDLTEMLAGIGLLVHDAEAAPLPTVVRTSDTGVRVYAAGQDPEAYDARYDTYRLMSEEEYTTMIANLIALREYVRGLPPKVDPDVEAATKALTEVGMDDTDGPVPAEVARRLKAAGYTITHDGLADWERELLNA